MYMPWNHSAPCESEKKASPVDHNYSTVFFCGFNLPGDRLATFNESRPHNHPLPPSFCFLFCSFSRVCAQPEEVSFSCCIHFWEGSQVQT